MAENLALRNWQRQEVSLNKVGSSVYFSSSFSNQAHTGGGGGGPGVRKDHWMPSKRTYSWRGFFYWVLLGVKESTYTCTSYTWHVGFVYWQKCEGVSSWRYHPWSGWYTGTNNGQLKTVTYKKLRNDTILRVTFHSAFAQYHHGRCSEYYIQFGGRDCSQPAPIATIMYIQNYGGASLWHSIPAEVSGFCNATSEGQLLPGNIQVSVHIKDTCSGGNAHTGPVSGRMTSYLLIEEYCV